MKTFVIVNHYCKDGQSKFYHHCTFACDSIDQAVQFFQNRRFFISGTYRLFYVDKKALETGVIVDILPTFLDINKCLMTRVCKWDETGDFNNDLFLGTGEKDYNHDDLIHIFKVNLPHCYNAIDDNLKPEVF